MKAHPFPITADDLRVFYHDHSSLDKCMDTNLCNAIFRELDIPRLAGLKAIGHTYRFNDIADSLNAWHEHATPLDKTAGAIHRIAVLCQNKSAPKAWRATMLDLLWSQFAIDAQTAARLLDDPHCESPRCNCSPLDRLCYALAQRALQNTLDTIQAAHA